MSNIDEYKIEEIINYINSNKVWSFERLVDNIISDDGYQTDLDWLMAVCKYSSFFKDYIDSHCDGNSIGDECDNDYEDYDDVPYISDPYEEEHLFQKQVQDAEEAFYMFGYEYVEDRYDDDVLRALGLIFR